MISQNVVATPSILASVSNPAGWVRTFPWLLFLVIWSFTFGFQHRMDAPLFWLEGGASSSDMALMASTGNPERRILTFALGLVGLLLWRSKHLRPRGDVAVTWAWLSFMTWAALSILWADDPALAFRRLVAFAMMILLTIGCAAATNLDNLSRLVVGIGALNLVPGVFAEMRAGTFHPLVADYRFGGTLYSNLQGAMLSVAVLIMCWWAWRTRGIIRLAVLLTVGGLLTFLMMTRSRTSIVSLLVALGFSVVLIAVRHVPTMARLVILSIFGVVLCVGAIVVGNASPSPRVLNIFQQDRDEGDPTQLTGRVDIWKTCLQFSGENPVLGSGFGGFWSAEHIDALNRRVNSSLGLNQCHSAYLDQLLEIGPVGASLYVVLLAMSVVLCTRYFMRGDNTYGLWAALSVLTACHNIAESINMSPVAPTFILYLILSHLAFVAPTSQEGGTASGSRQTSQYVT